MKNKHKQENLHKNIFTGIPNDIKEIALSLWDKYKVNKIKIDFNDFFKNLGDINTYIDDNIVVYAIYKKGLITNDILTNYTELVLYNGLNAKDANKHKYSYFMYYDAIYTDILDILSDKNINYKINTNHLWDINYDKITYRVYLASQLENKYKNYSQKEKLAKSILDIVVALIGNNITDNFIDSLEKHILSSGNILVEVRALNKFDYDMSGTSYLPQFIGQSLLSEFTEMDNDVLLENWDKITRLNNALILNGYVKIEDLLNYLINDKDIKITDIQLYVSHNNSYISSVSNIVYVPDIEITTKVISYELSKMYCTIEIDIDNNILHDLNLMYYD